MDIILFVNNIAIDLIDGTPKIVQLCPLYYLYITMLKIIFGNDITFLPPRNI